MLCLAGVCSSGVFSSGDVGDESRSAAGLVEAGRNAAELIVRTAEKEVGVCESGENTGARVDQYNAYIGLRKVAWCASFVSWCHGKAGYPEPKTAWSPTLFPPSRISKEAAPGMVMGIYFPELRRIAHCGIVAHVKGDYVYTVEGNTNASGSREGIGVFRRLRHRRTIAKYADWIRPVPP